MSADEVPILEIIDRLERLEDFLVGEGWYVHSNTAWLAIQALRKSMHEPINQESTVERRNGYALR